MLGFTEREGVDTAYGLIPDGRRRSALSPKHAAAGMALMLVGIGACGLLVTQAAIGSPTMIMKQQPLDASSKKNPKPEACATKPFGQCAGMNFSASKDDRDAYNFTTAAEPFACCPAGTSCVSFGPV